MRIKQLFALIILSGLLLTSCSEDDDTNAIMPTISGLEVGIGNSLTATIGEDLHFDAEVVAPAGLDEIEIHMHLEEGGDYDIEETFEYDGEKNTKFHEHIDIPLEAPAGEYHMHFKVKDLDGNETEVDAEVMITQ